MQVSVHFNTPSEAERLRTAVLRFAEAKARRNDPPPTVRDEGRAGAVVELWSDQAAEDFSRYWTQFRTETMSWSGFRDI